VGSGGRRRPVRFVLLAPRWRLAAPPPCPLAASLTSVPLSLAGLDLGTAAPAAGCSCGLDLPAADLSPFVVGCGLCSSARWWVLRFGPPRSGASSSGPGAWSCGVGAGLRIRRRSFTRLAVWWHVLRVVFRCWLKAARSEVGLAGDLCRGGQDDPPCRWCRSRGLAAPSPSASRSPLRFLIRHVTSPPTLLPPLSFLNPSDPGEVDHFALRFACLCHHACRLLESLYLSCIFGLLAWCEKGVADGPG
jgi:hypothetical protein